MRKSELNLRIYAYFSNVLPLIMGIDGIMYAGPIADGLAAVVAIVMIRIEFSRQEYRVNE